jgi:radical SAM protein with 4Fe4S-binding SPASM domain
MKKREKATDELIDKIIAECIPNATACCPFLIQEPLLESRLRDVLMKIKRTNWKCETTIYTTMNTKDMEMLLRVVDDMTLDNICVSLYGKKWQKGLNKKLAEENTRKLIQYRNKSCLRKPTVTMQWIIDLPGKEEHHKKWNGIADGIQIVPYDTFHGTVAMPDGIATRTKGPNVERKPCSRLWNGLNVHSDGNVVSCCIDYQQLEILGNMYNNTALEIWNSPKATRLRELHMQKRWNEIELCKNCNVWEWDR